MKTKNYVWMFVAFLFALAFGAAAHAQVTGNSTADTVAAATAAAGWVALFTPVITPLIIAGIKKITPKIPSWTLPIIAPVLGMMIDYINAFATGHSTNTLVAAALGLAGVGVREVVDQLKPASATA